MTNGRVLVDPSQPITVALLRLKRQLARDGLFRAMQRRKYAISPGEARRRKSRLAQRAARKRQLRSERRRPVDCDE
jgi:ribosomal protein S21